MKGRSIRGVRKGEGRGGITEEGVYARTRI